MTSSSPRTCAPAGWCPSSRHSIAGTSSRCTPYMRGTGTGCPGWRRCSTSWPKALRVPLPLQRAQRHPVDERRRDQLDPLAQASLAGHDQLARAPFHRAADKPRAFLDRHGVRLVEAALAGGTAVGAVAVDADAGGHDAGIDDGDIDAAAEQLDAQRFEESGLRE